MTCSIGVMPVPPDIMPSFFACNLLAPNHELSLAHVLVDAPRPGDGQLIAHFERMHILRHLATVWEAIDDAAFVDLDHEVHKPNVVIRGGRRVLALNLFL